MEYKSILTSPGGIWLIQVSTPLPPSHPWGCASQSCLPMYVEHNVQMHCVYLFAAWSFFFIVRQYFSATV